MTSTGPHTSPDACLDAASPFFVIEKSHMLFPWQTYHNPQTMALCRIKEPARWDSIGTDGVQTIARHLGKVMFDGLGVMIFMTVCIRAKRPVRDPPDPQFGIPHEKKFALHVRSV
jgi:hypothetical protein